MRNRCLEEFRTGTKMQRVEKDRDLDIGEFHGTEKTISEIYIVENEFRFPV